MDPLYQTTEPHRVMVECPECHAQHEDHDGFGFVYCDLCGECTHPSGDFDDDGYVHCTVCGDCIGAPNNDKLGRL